MLSIIFVKNRCFSNAGYLIFIKEALHVLMFGGENRKGNLKKAYSSLFYMNRESVRGASIQIAKEVRRGRIALIFLFN